LGSLCVEQRAAAAATQQLQALSKVAAGGPWDIYGASGTPCIAAHSAVRVLAANYTGPLISQTILQLRFYDGAATSPPSYHWIQLKRIQHDALIHTGHGSRCVSVLYCTVRYPRSDRSM
jgi:hypothetical protein